MLAALYQILDIDGQSRICIFRDIQSDACSWADCTVDDIVRHIGC